MYASLGEQLYYWRPILRPLEEGSGGARSCMRCPQSMIVQPFAARLTRMLLPFSLKHVLSMRRGLEMWCDIGLEQSVGWLQTMGGIWIE